MTGVASERDPRVLHSDAEASRLRELLDARGVSGKQLHATAFGTAADGMTVVVSWQNLHDEDRLRPDLSEALADQTRVIDGPGAVSVVGAGINVTYATVRRGSAALRQRGVVAQGVATSSFRITWLVPRATVDDSVRALHEVFLEQPQPVP